MRVRVRVWERWVRVRNWVGTVVMREVEARKLGEKTECGGIG